ncbi:hypothetical protein CC2G_010103 [Coprinopsis cinerea AmutBmut pab1-1]|nr:hypothetical protein CC2G_010103 [Coprinopsis cinerea AmutBmut pab1-1]
MVPEEQLCDLPRLYASRVLHQFESITEPDTAADAGAPLLQPDDIVSFITILLCDSQVTPCVALASLRLVERFQLFSNRIPPRDEIQRILFAAFMLAAKIVSPRCRVRWASIGEKLVEGRNVFWLEKEFLIDVRWDYEMLDVVEEVWDAFAEARKGKYGPVVRENVDGDGVTDGLGGVGEGEDWKSARRLSKTSSTTTISYQEETSAISSSSFRTPLILASIRTPRMEVAPSHRSSGGSSLRQAYKPTTSKTSSASQYLDVINVDRERKNTPPKLRKRMSQIFLKGM